jgi:hypothetical protein
MVHAVEGIALMVNHETGESAVEASDIELTGSQAITRANPRLLEGRISHAVGRCQYVSVSEW